jgi:predicted RNase H-like HicB family nuclease
MEVTCFVKKEGNQYASLCVELDVASCGRTKKEALDGLKRAIETYVEYMISEGRDNEVLTKLWWLHYLQLLSRALCGNILKVKKELQFLHARHLLRRNL